MQITTITVTYGRKVNLGDYNSLNLEVTLGAGLEPEEEYEPALSRLWEIARESVKEQAVRATKKREASHEN